MSRHALRDFSAPAVRQVIRNAGGAEGVAAYRRFNVGVCGAAAHHVPDIGARERPLPELLCFADRGAEQRSSAIPASLMYSSRYASSL